MESTKNNIVKQFQEEDLALFQTIKEFQEGHGEKATIIYETTKKYSYRLIFSNVTRMNSQHIISGDVHSITEDIMQELYLEFFRTIKSFRNEDPKSFYKWISIVSNRMVSKYIDKNKMEILQGQQNEDFSEEKDIWDSSEINDSDLEDKRDLLPEAALEDKEFKQVIMDFIQSLPEAQAQTVIYHFYSGMKYQEIADLMGVSLITVKTRMRKAQDSLKEIVEQYEKKTGTKLRSVSVLPLLWLLYRLSIQDTKVPKTIGKGITKAMSSNVGVASNKVGVVKKVITSIQAMETKRVVAVLLTCMLAAGGAYVATQAFTTEEEQKKTEESMQDETSEMDENPETELKDTEQNKDGDGQETLKENENPGEEIVLDENNDDTQQDVPGNNSDTSSEGTPGTGGSTDSSDNTEQSPESGGNDTNNEEDTETDSAINYITAFYLKMDGVRKSISQYVYSDGFYQGDDKKFYGTWYASDEVLKMIGFSRSWESGSSYPVYTFEADNVQQKVRFNFAAGTVTIDGTSITRWTPNILIKNGTYYFTSETIGRLMVDLGAWEQGIWGNNVLEGITQVTPNAGTWE